MFQHTTTRLAAVTAVLLCSGLGLAGAAQADFGFSTLGGAATTLDGSASTQAGSHPDLTTTMVFNRRPDGSNPDELPVEDVRDIEVALPVGMTGNPTAAPTCSLAVLSDNFDRECPIASQIGRVQISTSPQLDSNGLPLMDIDEPLYNLERTADAPALFGFKYAGAVIVITAKVRPDDYGISALSVAISQAYPIYGLRVKIWGIPADPLHDPDRGIPFGGVRFAKSPDTRKPFLTSPMRCTDVPLTTKISMDSYQRPGVFVTGQFDHDLTGNPFVVDGCEKLPFQPSIDIQPLSQEADAPTGLDVNLSVPQNASPDGVATAHVRNVKVTLPLGMSVSPSSAAGLGACSLAQIKLGSDEDAACPRSSVIGDVQVDTPLLEKPMQGDIILAAQDDNPFRSLLAMYVVAKGPGVVLKLPGRIDADPVTGQLTTTFDNNPQLPFERLNLRFRGGSQASLATPPRCGSYISHVEVASWASNRPVVLDAPMVIDRGCQPRGFAPGVAAGSGSPQAGASASFSLTLTRPDRQQYLSGVETVMPPGLLARIKDVDQCPEPQASNGLCGSTSLVGSTAVLSGPGSAPLPVNGVVYLTGPYKGAPFGLSIVVRTAGQAGPFDLGDIVVRAQILVDRGDAHVTVKADPLPTIIQGFPLRMRRVSVSIDRPGFMLNPTGCQPSSVQTTVSSVDGVVVGINSPFRVSGCGDLGLDQKLAFRFTNKSQMTPKKHPGVVATVTSEQSGTNLGRVVTKLPLSVALDPDNARALCKPQEREALKCPEASIVGSAKAVSVLRQPLTGPVYFVEGTRITKEGRTAATLPKLWIPLSGDGVTLDVNADSSVSRGQLVTTFADLPDAPLSSFALKINGGKHGILVVPPSSSGGVCDRDRTVDMQFTGQNEKVLERALQAQVECPFGTASRSVSSRRVKLRVRGIGAGRLTVSGKGVKTKRRTIKRTSIATITANLTTSGKRAYRGHRAIRVRVAFAPKGKGKTTQRLEASVKHAKAKKNASAPRSPRSR